MTPQALKKHWKDYTKSGKHFQSFAEYMTIIKLDEIRSAILIVRGEQQ